MTAANATSSHKRAFKSAVFGDGLYAIFRTGGIKTTHALGDEDLEWAVVKRESFLVKSDKKYENMGEG